MGVFLFLLHTAKAESATPVVPPIPVNPLPTCYSLRSRSTDVVWQLLYPSGNGQFDVLDLTSMMLSEQGSGMPPLHYNTQRGTYQHGETPVSMRLDPRIIMLSLVSEHDSRSQMYDNLERLLGKLNPGRNWGIDGDLTTCIYRKIIPGGRMQWRSDLVTTGGSKTITSNTGRFAEWGLSPGDSFIILTGSNAGDYVVEQVVNENTLLLTQEMAFSDSGSQYRVFANQIVRDIYVLLEDGPRLVDDREVDTLSMSGVIKLIAHDPVWRNPILQSITWQVQNLSNLVFYENPNWLDRAVFPIWFGSNFISAETALVYHGTWFSRPMIIINGPFTKVELENISTGDKLHMLYTAGAGEQVTINLDALTVTNNYGQSLMRFMSTPYSDVDSDLITFGLYAAPQVVGGINNMRINISDAVFGQTSATMYWYARYIGV
jgi:hypothetical protein